MNSFKYVFQGDYLWSTGTLPLIEKLEGKCRKIADFFGSLSAPVTNKGRGIYAKGTKQAESGKPRVLSARARQKTNSQFQHIPKNRKNTASQFLWIQSRNGSRYCSKPSLEGKTFQNGCPDTNNSD